MTLYHIINENKSARLIFGPGEIRIIKKQLLGIKLTQSEKNRLSRSIRPKLNFISICSLYKDEFEVKKGNEIYMQLELLKQEVLKDIIGHKVKGIYLFGSFVENKMSMDSDVDIAIEFENIIKRDAALFKMRINQKVNKIFQISVYNYLPNKIQEEILKNGRIYFKNKR